MSSNDKNTDLDLLRNNFISIEFFNLEHKFKQFFIRTKTDSTDLLARIDKLQSKVTNSSLEKREQIIKSLEQFRLYLTVIESESNNLYIDTNQENNSTLPSINEGNFEGTGFLSPLLVGKKPYKNRKPPAIPKPKKPKDLENDP